MNFNKEAKTLTVFVFLLVGFGLLMLSSAGIVEGQKKFGSSQYFFFHQLFFGVLLGTALYFLFSKLSYTIWQKLAMPVLLTSLLLMVAVFLPQFGFTAKGATRWLNFGFISFQPAEILKFGLIVYFAAWFTPHHSLKRSGTGFSGRREKSKNWSYYLMPFLIVLGFVALLLVLQPDMGTLSIISLIALAIFFFAGAKMSSFWGLMGVLGAGFISFALLSSYQLNRLLAFFNRAGDPQGISYHINQSLLAIGQGGLWGVGFGQSQQKTGFLPEPVSDSIFAIIIEETGLAGAGFLLVLFLLLAWQLIKIARRSEDKFAQLFVLGVTIWIMGQAFINMAAITGLIPLTGLPLPFISHGGTSLAVLLASLGVVANIANHET